MRKSILYLIAFIALLSGGYACSCAPFELEQNYNISDVIFTGEVLSVEDNGPSAQKELLFDVYESFKGDNAQSIELKTPSNSASCGYDFKEGEEYLVYARYSEGDSLFKDSNAGLVTTLCSANKPLSEANDDIEQIKGLRGSKVAQVPINTSSKVDMLTDLEVSIVSDDTINYNFTLMLPTPCHNFTTKTTILESYPLQVRLDVNIKEPPQGTICAQVIDMKNVTGSISTDGPIGKFTIYLDGEKRAQYQGESFEKDDGNQGEDDISLFRSIINWFKSLF